MRGFICQKKKNLHESLGLCMWELAKKKKNAVDVLASIAVIIRYKIKWTTATQQSVHH